jgi:hypothetical protein
VPKWEGTGRDYSKIVFSRKFHPPLRNGGAIVDGEWYDHNQTTIVRMAAFKHFKDTEAKAIRRIIQVLNHEATHGVILGVQWKDKIPIEEIGESEWALDNGLDIFMSKSICKTCK